MLVHPKLHSVASRAATNDFSHLHQNENESINIDYNLCSDDRETVGSSLAPNTFQWQEIGSAGVGGG